MKSMADRRDTLATAIDLRLVDLWADLFEAAPEGMDAELLAWFLRAAYGQGYTDALRESTRGQLCLDLGYSGPDAAA
jgi:hypothetical protein